MTKLKLVEVVREGAPEVSEETISRPGDAVEFLKDLKDKPREHFVVLHLDTRNRVISRETVSIGTLNASLVHPREVFLGAIKACAATIIVAHTHPSGDVTPSAEDIQLTKRLHKAGKILGIEVLDHVIIGGDKFMSMKEAGSF